MLALLAATVWGPELISRWNAPGPRLARDTLRVATFNLAEQNQEDPGMLQAIRELDADVLVLPEFTWWFQRQLQPGLAALYPYEIVGEPPYRPGYALDGQPDAHSTGFVLFSSITSATQAAQTQIATDFSRFVTQPAPREGACAPRRARARAARAHAAAQRT